MNEFAILKGYHGRVKPNTIKLVFAASSLSRATWQHVDCCFCVLTL